MISVSDDPLSCTFVAVDVETTGLFSKGHDRIIEIAAVRFRLDGAVERSFVTLVNPERDIGPTRIHGIQTRDILAAPRFAEIIGDVLECLYGAVFVAHNATFDWGFVSRECARAGVSIPTIPRVCTLGIMSELDIDIPNLKLSTCAEYFDIKPKGAHTAEVDAICVVDLLLVLLSKSRPNRRKTLRECGCENGWPADGWPSARPSGKSVRRQAGTRNHLATPAYIATLIDRLPTESHRQRDPTTRAYFELLNRALEDRRVSANEAEELIELAEDWGLSRRDVLTLHRNYLTSLVQTALMDDVITEGEKADLLEVAHALALDRDDLAFAQELTRITPEEAPLPRLPNTETVSCESLSGKRVCFTGDLSCRLNGNHITRELAEELARRAGLEVAPSVTKKLDILVVADPDSMSGKAKKARQYGTRIMAERVFWRSIGISVE
jgi:DNA polymerase-3 subunit epsilon